MGSYTTTGAPVKIIIPGPSQKSQVELPKIKLQLSKQQNVMVRLPSSVVTSQSRGPQQQVQKIQQLQQVQQLQNVNLAQVHQVQQVNLAQQPQVKPVHLAPKPIQVQVFEEQKEFQESRPSYEQQVSVEKTVTFADVHYDQYGRCSPTHGSTASGRSTPSQTSSGRSSPAQSVRGDQPTAGVRQRRSSGSCSPVQSIHGDQQKVLVRQRRISESSSSVQSIQGDHSTALVRQRRSSGSCSPVQNNQRDQTVALLAQKRPSITQLVLYQPQQQIVPKLQHHTIQQPTNKRKASLTSANMQLALPNQQRAMAIPKKQVEYQQMPMGYKAARKTSIPGQIVIKLVLK